VTTADSLCNSDWLKYSAAAAQIAGTAAGPVTAPAALAGIPAVWLHKMVDRSEERH